jgi:pSer/pThr/pTyr-binding forkhead associated (FHA) protein
MRARHEAGIVAVSLTSPLRLCVIEGAMAGTEFRIPGVSVVVGRSPDCAISIADPSLSRRHFEVVLEDDVWRIKDLQSRNGISVNGEAVRQAVVRAGDEIRAGDMIFRLEVASARLSESGLDAVTSRAGMPHPTSVPIQLFPSIVPTLSAEAPRPADGTLLATLLSSLRPASACRLYALVDGAQAFKLAFAARLMGHDLYTLFSGELAETVAHVGPCLVVIGERSAFVRKWVEEMGSHAGVLFESTTELNSVCAHLRNVFVATDEEGQEYFFRFYDPRVLRTFLPTCRKEELREFFGPIDRWIAESADGAAFTAFTLEQSGLVERHVASTERQPPNVGT